MADSRGEHQKLLSEACAVLGLPHLHSGGDVRTSFFQKHCTLRIPHVPHHLSQDNKYIDLLYNQSSSPVISSLALSRLRRGGGNSDTKPFRLSSQYLYASMLPAVEPSTTYTLLQHQTHQKARRLLL